MKKGLKSQDWIIWTSFCTNPTCILVKSGSSHKDRDAIPYLAIGLSGLSYSALGVHFPLFNPIVGYHQPTLPISPLPSLQEA